MDGDYIAEVGEEVVKGGRIGELEARLPALE